MKTAIALSALLVAACFICTAPAQDCSRPPASYGVYGAVGAPNCSAPGPASYGYSAPYASPSYGAPDCSQPAPASFGVPSYSAPTYSYGAPTYSAPVYQSAPAYYAAAPTYYAPPVSYAYAAPVAPVYGYAAAPVFGVAFGLPARAPRSYSRTVTINRRW
jgi:hypothetical protein